jgi:hypothetical protein
MKAFAPPEPSPPGPDGQGAVAPEPGQTDGQGGKMTLFEHIAGC